MATPIPPMLFAWSGEALIPKQPRFADRHFVIGQSYLMEERHDRSANSHNHEFAWLEEAWKNLPENLAEDFPSSKHLRKRALIAAGFYNETLVDAGSNAAALRVAHGFRALDEFAHVVVRGPLVAVRVAKSQSRRAMDKKEFQASKTAIMEVVSAMVGVSPAELSANAGQAA